MFYTVFEIPVQLKLCFNSLLSSAKRLAQMSSLSLPVVNLMPSAQWAILKEEKVLALLVEVSCIFPPIQLNQEHITFPTIL